MSNACTTHPAILCAERTGYGPNGQDVRDASEFGQPMRKKVSKDDRFYKFLLKYKFINEDGNWRA